MTVALTAGAAPADATRVTVTSSLRESPTSSSVFERRNTYAPSTGSVTCVTVRPGWRIVAPSPPAGAETSDHCGVPAYPARIPSGAETPITPCSSAVSPATVKSAPASTAAAPR